MAFDTGYSPSFAGECWWGTMVREKRLYTPGQIERAGRTLTNSAASKDELTEAFSIVDNWRTAHAYPLELARNALDQRVAEICPDAVIPERPIVSERLKRIESIREKLIREPKMNLVTMQDIGGCRAVLRGPEEVEKLLRSYAGVADLKTTDYIASPRVSGYRSTHLVWRFRSQDSSTADYNNMRIEIQIRTALQHTWATAVEIASTFTGQDLKSDHPKLQDPDLGSRWVRFFALMGSAMANCEGGAPVRDTPTDKNDLIRELGRLTNDLRVQHLMKHWSKVTTIRDTKSNAGARLFLIVLRPHETQWYLKIKPFSAKDADKAAEERIRLEKESRETRGMQVVLVAVESIDMLRRAYPNYYADTAEFLKALQAALHGSSIPPPLLRELEARR